MPAPRKLDADTVLERAMQHFWRHGYARTSIDDLVRATGASRSSLYASFDSKEGLFRQALARYDHRCRRRELARLAREHPPLGAIRALFEGWVARVRDAADDRGCLLANTAIELGADASDAARLVADAQADTAVFFERQLRLAMRAGELPDDLDAPRAARALLASLLGLLVLIRARPDEAVLNDVVSSALASLHASSASASG